MVRSEPRSAATDRGGAESVACAHLDAGLPFAIRTWNDGSDSVLFPARVATVSLGVLGGLGAMLAITGDFRHGRLLRKQAPAGIRIAASPWARSVRRC